MNKLNMQSYDVIASNVEKIAKLFPNCVTECKDKDSNEEKIKLAIDFEKLKAELSNDIIGEGEERYQFTWPDKRAAVRLANKPITETLRPCREESVDFDNTQNLYIEGDNLDVLKVLRETYLGKVKMIYIDPPYNTGHDFVYNDDFTESYEEFAKSCKVYDENGNLQFNPKENGESNGRFHTDWLNKMYPRIKVARDLLAEDGVMIISISDAEFHNLKKIGDEIFGDKNYCGDILWNSTKSVTNTALISVSHPYNLIYFKDKNYLKNNRFEFRLPDDGEGFANPDNDPRGPWKADPFQVGGWRPNQQYEIVNPNTGVVYTPNVGCSWKNDYAKFQELIEDNRIVFGVTGNAGPQRKRFIWEAQERGKVVKTWWDDVETTTNGTELVKKLFDGKSVFDNPKPVGFIKKLLQLAMNHKGIVLDFFSGSSTTAHAVMKLNAEDGGKRKFIMVQLPELTDAKSEAYKAGYKNICEIGKERIRRAGKKVKEEAGLDGKNLDIGFRVLKLDSSNMADVYYTPQESEQRTLFDENVKPDRSNEDLLFQVMLDLGIELSAKIEAKQIAGKTVHFVDGNYLVACFDSEVNETTIIEIAKKQPVYFVMRDSSAANDNVIDNFEQIFKHYSPTTTCRII